MTIKEVSGVVLGIFLVNNILARVRCFGIKRCFVSSALYYHMNRRFKKLDRMPIVEFVDAEMNSHNKLSNHVYFCFIKM